MSVFRIGAEAGSTPLLHLITPLTKIEPAILEALRGAVVAVGALEGRLVVAELLHALPDIEAAASHFLPNHYCLETGVVKVLSF